MPGYGIPYPDTSDAQITNRDVARGRPGDTACFSVLRTLRCRANLALVCGIFVLNRRLREAQPLFLLGAAIMGVFAFVPAYRKKHGRKSCLALFVSGLLCLLLRRHIDLPALSIEPVVTTVGASLIIGAHVLNLRFSKRCQCCDPLTQAVREATHETQHRASGQKSRRLRDVVRGNPASTIAIITLGVGVNAIRPACKSVPGLRIVSSY